MMGARVLSAAQVGPDEVRRVLLDGGLIVFPTDTVYGLGTSARCEEALRRLRRLKGRPPSKPFSLHLADRSQVERFCAPLSPRQRHWIERLLPGPYTLLLPAAEDAPRACVAGGVIGLRVPDDEAFRRVASCGLPLVGTSVNRAGQPPLLRVEDIVAQFGEAVELILTGERPPRGKSSSVLDLTVDPPRARRGRLPDGLAAALEDTEARARVRTKTPK